MIIDMLFVYFDAYFDDLWNFIVIYFNQQF